MPDPSRLPRPAPSTSQVPCWPLAAAMGAQMESVVPAAAAVALAVAAAVEPMERTARCLLEAARAGPVDLPSAVAEPAVAAPLPVFPLATAAMAARETVPAQALVPVARRRRIPVAPAAHLERGGAAA